MSVSSSNTSLATTHLVLNPGLSPNASLLDALPEEIVVRILEWCDIGGVFACRQTCRAFRNMTEGSAGLRYKLALSKNGMCDDPRSRLAVAEKLELLTSHTAAWRRLHAVQHEWVESLVGWSSLLVVSGNIFVFSRECNNTRGEHEPVFPAAPVEEHYDLLVVRVPSPHRRIEGAKWMLWLPESAYEMCIDAAQDLLIYSLCVNHDAQLALYVCTLSTGLVHPSVIGHSGCLKLRQSLLTPRVCGEYIAAGTRSCLIAIWNWKTGELVSYQRMSSETYSSFDFLDEHHILCAVDSEDSDSEDSIDVYDWRYGELATGAKARRLRFQLGPRPIYPDTHRYIKIRRNALPVLVQGRELHEGDNELTGAPPFYADPRARLVSLCIVTNSLHREEQFELHVPAQALLEQFSANHDTGADMVLPWSAWHAETAVTPVRTARDHVPAHMTAYGMRTVSNPPHWYEDVVYLDSYSPRRAGAIGAGTRQCIRLPDKPSEEVELFHDLCEDGLLCYQLDPSEEIVHAYWFAP